MSIIRETRPLESFVESEQLGNQTISVRNEGFPNSVDFDRRGSTR